MTRDPDTIRGELAKHTAADAMVRDQIERTRNTVATKRTELATLEYHVDMLLLAQERRRVAEDKLLDELNTVSGGSKELV